MNDHDKLRVAIAKLGALCDTSLRGKAAADVRAVWRELSDLQNDLSDAALAALGGTVDLSGNGNHRYYTTTQPEAQQPEAVADEELPGMWSASDFTGGDPDERSHAERTTPTHDGGGEKQWLEAFVAGAKWWEWHKTGATMWQSDQALAYAEGQKKYAALTPATPQGVRDGR